METKVLLSLFFGIYVSSLAHACPHLLTSGLHPTVFKGFSYKITDFSNPYNRSMGRLKFNGMTRCSPTLVDVNIIALNAHCVLDENNKYIDTKYEFVMGAVVENSKDHNSRRFNVDSSKTRVATMSPSIESKNDIAFMTLSEAVPSSYALPMPISTVHAITPITPLTLTANLHRPISADDNKPIDQHCRITGTENNVGGFLSDCSTTHRMSSGSLHTNDTIPKMIGMVLGVDSENDFDDNTEKVYDLSLSNLFIDGASIAEKLQTYKHGGLIKPF